MARPLKTRAALLVLLMALLSVGALSDVWSYSAAQVDSWTEIAVVSPENALIATKNFSIEDSGIVLEDELVVRTKREVTMFSDGTTTAETSNDSVPARFTIRNNLDCTVEIDLIADYQEVPTGLSVWFKPTRSRIASGKEACVSVFGEDELTPNGSEKHTFIIPLTIEAYWEGGQAKLEVVIPGRLERRYKEQTVELVIPLPESSLDDTVEGSALSEKSKYPSTLEPAVGEDPTAESLTEEAPEEVGETDGGDTEPQLAKPQSSEDNDEQPAVEDDTPTEQLDGGIANQDGSSDQLQPSD